MDLIIILVSLLAVVIVTFFTTKRVIIEFISIFASLAAFVVSLIIAGRVVATGTYTPYQFLSVDALGVIFMVIIGLVGFAATMYSVQYLREESAKQLIGFHRVKQYFILLNLFLAAMFLAVMSNNPIITWISIEATTLSTAFLISFYNKPAAMEAGWKYLIINSIGLLLSFFGTLLYFSSFHGTGGNFLTTWNNLLLNAVNLNPVIAKMAFIFVLIGYGTKIGLAPMHTWLPDAHSKAPVPISALLSGVLLNVAFLAMLRFKVITDSSTGHDFTGNLLMAFGLLSIIIPALIIFTQKNYKRLLAYSSIENMGVTALGFGFGGIASFGAILHMIYQAFAKSILFFSAGNVLLKYGSTKIANIKGVLSSIPITGVIFLLGFLAATGIPPFGIFFTEVTIFSVGIINHPIISFIAILFLALIFIGFLRLVVQMLFGNPSPDIKKGESFYLAVPSLILMIIIIVTSVYLPASIKSLIDAAVAFTH